MLNNSKSHLKSIIISSNSFKDYATLFFILIIMVYYIRRHLFKLAVFLLVCCTAVEMRANETLSSKPPIIGIQIHGLSKEKIQRLKECGISWIREDMDWQKTEKEKGKLSIAQEDELEILQLLSKNIQPLLILAYGNKFYDAGSYPVSPKAVDAFTRFAVFTAKHFKGKVHAYEVWNEWNWGCGMREKDGKGTSKDYVALLKKTYPLLKKIDPTLLVLGGGMADSKDSISWLKKACDLGMLDYCDGLSIHPYCFADPVESRMPEKYFVQKCENILKTLKQYNRDIPIYITEVGWPTFNHKYGTSISNQANYLARTFLLGAMFPQVKGIWWYDLMDDGLDPQDKEHHFGVVYHDLTPKAAFFALQDIAAFLKEHRFVERISVDNDSVYILLFKTNQNQPAWAVWCSTPHSFVSISIASRTSLPISIKKVGMREIQSSWTPGTTAHSYTLHLTADETPLLITPAENSKK